MISISLQAQANMPEGVVYPDTLWSSTDSFHIASTTFNESFTFPITAADTVNLGTNGNSRGGYFTIYTDLDSLRVRHVNFPAGQLIKIPIASPWDTTICILRFQASTSNFTDAYMREAKGKVSFRIPPVYELANIILYLSDCSVKTENHSQEGAYVADVVAHFSGMKSHDLIKALNTQCADADRFWDYYYSFRENSLCFSIDVDNILQYDTPYKHIRNGPSNIFGGEFRNLLYLIQDFAIQSGFYTFYNAHLPYYQTLEKRQAELLPVQQMWQWLEREFPYRRDAYGVVFSPLIEGSHSTQQLDYGPLSAPDFVECLMFINSSEFIDANPAYSEALKEGLHSGVVFTEIDHNYINPASDEYRPEVKALIADKDFWATEDAQRNYGSESAIFNEYATHSLFCLYVEETYNEATAKKVIADRVRLMERRGFYRFAAFNTAFSSLRKANPSQTIYELYGRMIEEMHAIK
jgi:hypothetical protein